MEIRKMDTWTEELDEDVPGQVVLAQVLRHQEDNVCRSDRVGNGAHQLDADHFGKPEQGYNVMDDFDNSR
jgi:hypothetical protein